MIASVVSDVDMCLAHAHPRGASPSPKRGGRVSGGVSCAPVVGLVGMGHILLKRSASSASTLFGLGSGGGGLRSSPKGSKGSRRHPPRDEREETTSPSGLSSNSSTGDCNGGGACAEWFTTLSGGSKLDRNHLTHGNTNGQDVGLWKVCLMAPLSTDNELEDEEEWDIRSSLSHTVDEELVVRWNVDLLVCGTKAFSFLDEMWNLSFHPNARGGYSFYLTLLSSPPRGRCSVHATFSLLHDVLPVYSRQEVLPFVFDEGVQSIRRGWRDFVSDENIDRYATGIQARVRLAVHVTGTKKGAAHTADGSVDPSQQGVERVDQSLPAQAVRGGRQRNVNARDKADGSKNKSKGADDIARKVDESRCEKDQQEQDEDGRDDGGCGCEGGGDDDVDSAADSRARSRSRSRGQRSGVAPQPESRAGVRVSPEGVEEYSAPAPAPALVLDQSVESVAPEVAAELGQGHRQGQGQSQGEGHTEIASVPSPPPAAAFAAAAATFAAPVDVPEQTPISGLHRMGRFRPLTASAAVNDATAGSGAAYPRKASFP